MTLVLRHTIIAKHFMINHESFTNHPKKKIQNRLIWVIPFLVRVTTTITIISYILCEIQWLRYVIETIGVAPKLPILKGFLVAATP